MSFQLLNEDTPPSDQQPIKQKSFAKNVGENIAEAARPYARTATNLLGLGTGIAGDVASLLNDWVAGPISSAITGEKALPYGETPIGKLLPTSDKTTSSLRSIAPEYLSPKSKAEEFSDAVINDTALLFSPAAKTKLPFAKTVSAAQKVLPSFFTSLGSNLVGKGIEDWTGGDKEKGSYAKIGSMFALSLLNKPKAAQMASQLYKDAEAALPKGATANATNLERTLVDLRERMQKGTVAPSEKFILDEVDAILNKIKNGKISIEEAWASKRSLGEKLNQHIYQNPEKAAQARAKKLAANIQHGLGSVLEDYGKTNTKFGQSFKSAEEAFGTIAKSRFISRVIEKFMKNSSPSDSALVHLLGGSVGSALAAGGASVLGASGGTAGVAAAAYPVAQLAYRVWNSPVLRKYYLNTIKAAAAEDSVAFSKEKNNLKTAIKKEEKSDKFEFVD